MYCEYSCTKKYVHRPMYITKRITQLHMSYVINVLTGQNTKLGGVTHYLILYSTGADTLVTHPLDVLMVPPKDGRVVFAPDINTPSDKYNHVKFIHAGKGEYISEDGSTRTCNSEIKKVFVRPTQA